MITTLLLLTYSPLLVQIFVFILYAVPLGITASPYDSLSSLEQSVAASESMELQLICSNNVIRSTVSTILPELAVKAKCSFAVSSCALMETDRSFLTCAVRLLLHTGVLRRQLLLFHATAQ